MKELLTAEQVEAAMDRLYESIEAQLTLAAKTSRIALVGIRTRGETLARRIARRLAADHGNLPVDFGVLDITLYRDDLSRQRGAPLVRATDIDFDLDDTWVVLVDDVIQSGRSIRAALDALHDFGRPTTVRLAVLIDRGGRQLPISADFIGQRVNVDDTVRVQVRLKENDGKEGVFTVKKGS